MPKPIDTNEIRYKISHAHPITMEHVDTLCDELDAARKEIDRLRGEQQTPPQGKTVEVRVVIVLSKDGQWQSYAFKGEDNEPYEFLVEPGEAIYWLTADLPIPEEVTVVAQVLGAAPGLGYCPICGAPGIWREKRPNGNDGCANGHEYPSRNAKESV